MKTNKLWKKVLSLGLCAAMVAGCIGVIDFTTAFADSSKFLIGLAGTADNDSAIVKDNEYAEVISMTNAPEDVEGNYSYYMGSDTDTELCYVNVVLEYNGEIVGRSPESNNEYAYLAYAEENQTFKINPADGYQVSGAGVLNIAIGDLGNELGMGAIKDHLDKYVPGCAEGTCVCGCGGGIATRVAADNIITATVSDWGCYGMIAAIAYLLGDMDIMHDAELEKEVLCTAAKSGMVDMYGWTIPAIDGFDLQTNMTIVSLMRECIKYAPKLQHKCKNWFERTLALGFFEEN